MGRHAEKIGVAIGTNDLSNFSQNFLIKGMRLDNYSGSWLTITMNGIRQYCPPYTIGWMSPVFPWVQTGPTVEYTQGPQPALYPSSTDGYPAQIAVYEDAVPPAPGYSYLNPFGVIAGSGELIAYDTNVIVVTTGAAVAIPVEYTGLRRAVLLQSSKFNDTSGTIYIGGPSVTADDGAKGGIQLSPGMSYPMDLSALATPYAISDVVNQKLIVAEAK